MVFFHVQNVSETWRKLNRDLFTNNIGKLGHMAVVVQFYPWFKFNFLLFLGICMIMSLKQRKIKFEPRIKLNHNIAQRSPTTHITWI